MCRRRVCVWSWWTICSDAAVLRRVLGKLSILWVRWARLHRGNKKPSVLRGWAQISLCRSQAATLVCIDPLWGPRSMESFPSRTPQASGTEGEETYWWFLKRPLRSHAFHICSRLLVKAGHGTTPNSKGWGLGAGNGLARDPRGEPWPLLQFLRVRTQRRRLS